MKKLLFGALLATSMMNISLSESIKHFEIENNARITDQTIQYYLSEFKNKEYSPQLENNIINKLFNLGLFAQITTKFKGHQIIKIIVEENPMIEKIEIKGNKKVKTKTILDELFSQSGSSLNKTNLVRDDKMIKNIYGASGRFYMSEKSKIESTGPGKVNLIFDIQEGPSINIKNVFINGLEGSGIPVRILHKLISTKSFSLWSMITGGSVYRAQNLEQDAEIIKSYLMSQGFADAQVLSTVVQLSDNGKYFNLIFDVKLGNKYTFNNISIDNSTGVDVILNPQWIKNGSLYDRNKIDHITRYLSEDFSKHGYPEIKIQPDITKNYNKKTVDVKLLVENTNKYYIDNIIVTNNLKTKTSIILKKMKISEGDCFNQIKISKGIRKLYETGFFKAVKHDIITKQNGKLDLILNINEKPTAKLGGELSFATNKSPGFSLGFSDRNLIGTGKALNIGANINLEAAGDIGLSLMQPNIFDTDIGTFFSINFNTASVSSDSGLKKFFGIKNESYDRKSFQLSLGASYEWSDMLFQSIQYIFKNEKLSLSKDELEKAKKQGDIITTKEVGHYYSSAIQNKFIFDLSGDRPLHDRNMTFTFLSEISGIGGNVKYFKGNLEYKFVHQLSDTSFFKFKTNLGVIKAFGDYVLRVDEKYSMGEPQLRGFETRGIGPRIDLSKANSDIKNSKINEGRSLNGEWCVHGSLQYEKIMFMDDFLQVKGSAFIDIGTVFGVDKYYEGKYVENTTPRIAPGLSLSLENSMLPTATMWIAYPISSSKEDKSQYGGVSVNYEF